MRITKSFPHKLGREKAVERIKSAINAEKISLAHAISDPVERWVSDNQLDYSVKVLGFHLDGTLLVEDNAVVVDLNVPVVVMPVRGMVEDQLNQEMARLLG